VGLDEVHDLGLLIKIRLLWWRSDY